MSSWLGLKISIFVWLFYFFNFLDMHIFRFSVGFWVLWERSLHWSETYMIVWCQIRYKVGKSLLIANFKKQESFYSNFFIFHSSRFMNKIDILFFNYFWWSYSCHLGHPLPKSFRLPLWTFLILDITLSMSFDLASETKLQM